MNFFDVSSDGVVSGLDYSELDAWVVDFSLKFFQDLYFDSEKYADLIFRSTDDGFIKPDIDGFDVSVCFFCTFEKRVLRLLFSVNDQPFWVVQGGGSRCELLYFPESGLVVSLLKSVSSALIEELRNSYQSLSSDLLSEKRPLQFSGCLLGYPRPYHYYSDNVSGLYEISKKIKGSKGKSLAVTYIENEFFWGVKSLLTEESIEIVKSCGEISNECASGNAYLRLVRGSNRSYNNYGFRRHIISDSIGCVDLENKQYFESIVLEYDLVVLVGYANEKRSWVGQDDAVSELLNYLVKGLCLNVLLIVDGMTGSSNLDFVPCFKERKTKRLVSLSDSCFEVDSYDCSWMTTQEKIFIAQYVDFSITNALTDSINVSRFSALNGLGFCANGFDVDASHIHPRYSIVPRLWVTNQSDVLAADRVNFTILKDKFLGLAKEMIGHYLYESSVSRKVHSRELSFDRQIFDDIDFPLDRTLLTLSFKGESEGSTKIFLIFESHSVDGVVSKHKLLLGRQVEFESQVVKLCNFRITKIGDGDYVFDSIRLIFNEAPFYLVL